MAGGSNEPPDMKRKKNLYSVCLNFFCFDPLNYKFEPPVHPQKKKKKEEEDEDEDDNIEKFTTRN